MAKQNVWLIRIVTSKPLHEIATAIAGTGLHVEHMQLQQGKSTAPNTTKSKQGNLPLTRSGKSTAEAVEKRFSAMKRRRDHAVMIIAGILRDKPSITTEALANELNANHPTATTRYHVPWNASNVEAYYWEAFDRLTITTKE